MCLLIDGRALGVKNFCLKFLLCRDRIFSNYSRVTVQKSKYLSQIGNVGLWLELYLESLPTKVNISQDTSFIFILDILHYWETV